MDEHEGQGRDPLDAHVPDPIVGREGIGLPVRQRAVVDAFFAAARDHDYGALVEVLDPEVVLRSDGGDAPGASEVVQGAAAVAARALTFAQFYPYLRPALVNGSPGAVVVPRGRTFSVMGFTVVGTQITAVDVLSDAVRLRSLDLSALEEDDQPNVVIDIPPSSGRTKPVR